MLVRDFMTPDPKVLRVTDTLKSAAKLFHKYRINGAPVVDENDEICGLITTAHIVEAMMNDMPTAQTVGSVMTRNVITISPENTIEEVWRIPVGRLPVVDEEGKLEGILTRKDFSGIYYTEMRRARDEAQAFIRSAINGIVVINAYGNITSFNEAAQRLTGMEAEKALGKHVKEVIPDSSLDRVLQTGKSETGYRFTVNGQVVVCNCSPIKEGSKVVGALSIMRDTSEFAHIAKQLTERQYEVGMLESIFESFQNGMIVVDSEGIIIRVNQACEAIIEAARADLIGQAIADKIADTRLHIVARAGVAELGKFRQWRGRIFSVNRIPVFKDGTLVGAVGEVIPLNIKEITQVIESIQLAAATQAEPEPSLKTGTAKYTLEHIIGRSKELVRVKQLAVKAAAADSSVLITGESGTGKEMFAHAIHSASRRNARPFVCVNCAAIPAELLEAELFGYEEGAFTGAKKGGKIGKFEVAHTGTLFLDEIGDMPLTMQAKLLRVLQDHTFERIGGVKPVTCDVRLICATNKPLSRMVQQQQFREDLYYRLNVVQIRIPPLRERREDIGELATVLLKQTCERIGCGPKRLSAASLTLFRDYDWPGNVRELVNALEEAAVMVDLPVIEPHHFASLQILERDKAALADGLQAVGTEDDLSYEKQRIIEALQTAGGNKSLAAKALGIHRSTLYEKLKRYSL